MQQEAQSTSNIAITVTPFVFAVLHGMLTVIFTLTAASLDWTKQLAAPQVVASAQQEGR